MSVEGSMKKTNSKQNYQVLTPAPFFLVFLYFKFHSRMGKGASCRHYTISNVLGNFKFKGQNMQYIHALMLMSMAALWQPCDIFE